MLTFNFFLVFVALLLSFMSLVLIYFSIRQCRESEFVPIYYFIAFTAGALMLLSFARIESLVRGTGFILSSDLLQNLLIAYVALFIFGSIWQSHEAEMCILPGIDRD